MAIILVVFQEKMQGSLGNQYDWIKLWKKQLGNKSLEENMAFLWLASTGLPRHSVELC